MTKLDMPLNAEEKYLYGINVRLDRLIELLSPPALPEPVVEEAVTEEVKAERIKPAPKGKRVK